MRVSCSTVDTFIENLRGEKAYRDVVYYNKSRRGIGTTTPASSFEVYFALSTVLVFADGGQALLEYGQMCGIDRVSRPESSEGSEHQAKLMDQIREYCGSHSLTLNPGIVDI